jgi:hypothetical protein
MIDILQTVRTLTDMGIARQAIADVEFAVEVLEQLEFEPGCEGERHSTGTEGHAIEEHATWLRQAPCGDELMICDAWVKNALTYPFMCCTPTHDHPTHEFRFIPLTPPVTS